MGKHGPCYHCGVTSTPLWRNGPPEKPVLCNACGSRWRTKGSLVNYTPLHSRTESNDVEDYRVSKGKTAHIKKKETKVLKRKFDNNIAQLGEVPYPDYNKEFCKVFDEDTSNRSSSGSAISNSERCAQYGSVDVISDLTGPTKHIVCNTIAPSKKRSRFSRSQPSSVEKLTKDLYTIWQEQQSSCLSGCSEEDLLFETDRPVGSVEFGNGGLLIRHPSSMAREEESEASSLSIDHKQHIVNSQLMAFAGQMDDMNGNFSSRGIDKIKIPANPEQDQILRHNDQLEKLQILARHDSPLCHVDLQVVINLDNFRSHFTKDEQQQLLKFLPFVDTLEGPLRDSISMSNLECMFDRPQFKENLMSLQKLLADGVFENSLGGVSICDGRGLKKLVLSNSIKSNWVEQYQIFKDLKCKNIINHLGEFNARSIDYLSNVKRSGGGKHQLFAGGKVMLTSPKRIIKKSIYDQNELIDNESCFISASSLFSLRNENGSNVVEESCDQELLLDVPCNSSFPQAELLIPTCSSKL